MQDDVILICGGKQLARIETVQLLYELWKIKVYELEFNKMMFKLSFDFKCTMLNAKVRNIECNQKALNCCIICRVGQKYFNNLLCVKRLDRKKEFLQIRRFYVTLFDTFHGL